MILALFALVFSPVSHAGTVSFLNWTELHPTNAFPARTAFASAYDPVSKKIVVFGGTDLTTQFNDTWTFDGTTWTQVQTASLRERARMQRWPTMRERTSW